MLPHQLLVQRNLLVGGIAAICAAQAALLLVALSESEHDSEGPDPRTSWTNTETRELVNYLYENRLDGDGAGNFKQPTYDAAADHIGPHLLQGPVKTDTMCKRKWTAVNKISL